MNLIFLGSDNFAVPALQALHAAGEKISCVITQPDRKKGRGLRLAATGVKLAATKLGLKIYQPDNINSPEAIQRLKELGPDLLVVVAYGQLLSGEVLAIPSLLPINLHGSLLPKYRGAAPINWAIIKGEKITGVTVIKLTPQMDAGPVILQKAIAISQEDTALSLENRLSFLGSELLLSALELIKQRNFQLLPQEEKNVSFAYKLKREDGLINWQEPADSIYNLIRGTLGWPGAFTYYKGKLLKIFKAKLNPQISGLTDSPAGVIFGVAKEGISVATGRDALIIEELQIEGKKRMPTEEFISGYKICAGESLGKNSCNQKKVC